MGKNRAQKQKEEKTATDYRLQHEMIPGKVYTFTRRSTQKTARGTVKKTNYAPLGRPPSDKVAFGKYYAAAKVATPYAHKKPVTIDSHRKPVRKAKRRTAKKR